MIQNFDEAGDKYLVCELIEGRPFENMIWNNPKEKAFDVPLSSIKKTFKQYSFEEIIKWAVQSTRIIEII